MGAAISNPHPHPHDSQRNLHHSPLNLHPGQALQGAKLAAEAGSTLAPLAAPAGGQPVNPFLGNAHMSEQRA